MPHCFNQARLQLPEAISGLSELAYNLWFSWNEEACELFARIDRERWQASGFNPVKLLKETDEESLLALTKDSAYMRLYRNVMRRWDDCRRAGTWFDDTYPEHGGRIIAYFSAEFGLHESLPIYSGGLGVLAGDHCKSASDLGVPLVGVGLLYKKGYFRQKLDADGNQLAEPMRLEPEELLISLVPAPPTGGGRKDTDKEADQAAEKAADEKSGASPAPLLVEVPVADRIVQVQVWLVRVGRIPVYLLDADVDGNSPWDRELTAQLYGGGPDVRIAQELLLGIGGVKVLRALGISPAVFHMNEGHAAFLALERIREHLDEGLPFPAALEAVRAGTAFTTHTPVPAGHDAFPLPMLEYYLGWLLSRYPDHRDDLLRLGLEEDRQLFNMTYLALSTAALRNGVSRLHGHVSRNMFRAFHGPLEARDVPIGHITNGVHLSTWLAPELKSLLDRCLPGSWPLQQAEPHIWRGLELIPPETLWHAHRQLKQRLIGRVRANLAERQRRMGGSQEAVSEALTCLSPDVLTIGFARRFATYKRARLIVSDLERLDRLVNHPERPVQLIFAGKAHPADAPGQEMIRDIDRVSRMERFRGKVVLLENYDISLARQLVQGVDVWLNNPRRPHEASGTSGMKAAVNGVLHFSVLDGWWEEGYDGSNGWAIRDGGEADWETQDRASAESIFRTLEEEIAPLYYDGAELPLKWIERMKRSIATLAPVYNTHRMVRDYVSEVYIPSLRRAERLMADGGKEAAAVADFKRFMLEHWREVRIVEVNDGGSTPDGAPSAELKEVTATLKLGPIWHKDVALELIYYEERPDGWHPVIVAMTPARQLHHHTVQYSARIPRHLRHGAHFSLRARPVSDNFAHPFELPLVTAF